MIARYGFLFLAFLMAAAPGETLAGDSVDYKKSPLSNDEFGVEILLSQSQLKGCSAVSRLTSPPIFLSLFPDGQATLSIFADYYKIKSSSGVAKLKIKVADKNQEKVAVIDGKIATISLSGTEVASGASKPFIINDVQVDHLAYKNMYSITKECLSSYKK